MATHTPWGQSQQSERIAVGIMKYHTAGHGGIHLSPKRNALIPEYMRNDNAWYEEDCEWAIVAVVFATEYLQYQPSVDVATIAKSTLLHYYPEAYEKFYNVEVLEGQSSTRDRELFDERNKNNYLVRSADSVDNNMVECYATIGGRHDSNSKTFLVPKDEYRAKRFYFVIDLERHEEIVR